MSTNLQSILQQAEEYNDIADDMTEVVAGGGNFSITAGPHMGYLTKYVELGDHVQTVKGKAKPPAPMFKLGFTLFPIETVTGPDGSETRKFGDPVEVWSYSINRSRNEKARAHKLFKRMNRTGKAKNFAQLIGTKYIVPHTEEDSTKEPGKKVVRMQIDDIGAPIDLVTGKEYDLPPLPEEHLKLFLFERPLKAAWDSLFIDGKRDDGTSKNWLQDEILKAVNFPGSPLEVLLGGATIPPLSVPAAPAAPAEAPAAPPAAAPATPPAPAPAAVNVPVPTTVAPPAAPAAPAAPVPPAV